MFDVHDGFLVNGGLTAPAKIQVFILNQIIISVTYTQYCMAVSTQCSSTQTYKNQ